MKAVVLGAGGLVGRHLIEELRARGVATDAFDHAACPIEDRAAVESAVAGASVVVNAAAFTSVDGAEREPERAFLVNAFGAEQVARAAAAAGAAVVHLSTDFVFDGALDRPYDEFDAPAPQSTYARSKRAGELLVERAAPRHHLVRVQAVYGRGGTSFSSRLRALLARDGGRDLRIDAERRVQPTWARAAARVVVEIAATDHFGTWHASCRGEATWHAFALRLAARLGVEPAWQPVSSRDVSLVAHRPANCLLAHRRLAMCGLAPMPTWEEALDAFLDEEAGS